MKSAKSLFVDLDYTLGFYNSKQGTWLIYDGVVESLIRLKRHFELILLTANSRHKVLQLFAQHPAMEPFFVKTITCEDFAPHFLRLATEYQTRIQEGRVSIAQPFLEFLHEFWCEENELLPYDVWEKTVYFPQIAPNKAKVCGKHGFLIDDEFSNPEPNPLYFQMIQEGRCFYAGPRGGITAESGPDWSAITMKILKDME